jgi:hypothetical protein
VILALWLAAPIFYWTTHALEKIRPHDPMPSAAAHAVQLWAAQNEFEPFQIVLRADRDLASVDVDVSDLAGARATIPAHDDITVYFENYIHLTTPSSIEGEAGDWPDALIPRVDRYAGQRRNAFPMHLAARRNQPIWIEVYVPIGTPSGEYKGSVSVTVDGAPAAEIPIALEVWDFALPSTASLKTSFGLNGVTAVRKHFGKYTSDSDLFRLVQMYQKAALLHRISTHGGSMAPPRISTDGASIDWTLYDAEMGPFLNGTILGGRDPLPGAASTTADLRVPPALTEDQERPYYRQWIRHFREKGWLSRLFYYLWDEPALGVYSKVAGKGRAAHRADADVKNLVTVALNDQMAGVVDIWVPLINCLEKKPGFEPYCEQSAARDAYRGESAAGKALWWYQSCASHGCNTIGGDYFRGWPSYMIDAPPVGNRIFQWLAWKYGIEGELYFNMDEAYARAADPWESLYLFGGNGDGTLFYPGRPNRIGGTADIPVESIRLKLIREGLEDYEYLALCQRSGLGDLARSSVNRMATTLYQWDHNPAALYEVRKKMGEALSAMTKSRAKTD